MSLYYVKRKAFDISEVRFVEIFVFVFFFFAFVVRCARKTNNNTKKYKFTCVVHNIQNKKLYHTMCTKSIRSRASYIFSSNKLFLAISKSLANS